ncbi:MAG TPA: Lrp/AsnC family transcriptional regulator [Methanosarcinales archaeon]|nr:Lrp/AsnC family transcriptional regulator [Methanosarcinales archaeon]
MKENLEILEILEQNSKIQPEEIATLTGLSEGEVLKRIKEMEEKGIIRKYKTVIDWEKIDDEIVYAIIEVKIALARGIGYDSIAKRISRFPEVRSIRLVSGDHDLSITVKGRSMKEVAFFVAEKIASLDQVTSTCTHFVLKTYKEDGTFLYDEEKAERLVVSP